MGSTTDYMFEGWTAKDATGIEGKMNWQEIKPKAWEETDVDIKVTHCGMCGSDLHFLSNGWGASNYPLTVGHEIVGVAVRVGSKAANGIQVGDRVGVGAQGDACLGRFGKCHECDDGEENYCDKIVWAYNSPHFNGDINTGGFATYHRSPSHFVVKIPDGLESSQAAPMLCGGATMFRPLKVHGVKPGMSVGIVGVGGLGHYGVLFAKGMGARAVGISRRENKRQEVMSLGADEYIATADEEGWETKHARSLDLIISTVASSKVPVASYMSLLKKGGSLVQVGLPDDGPFQIPGNVIVHGRTNFEGSLIGSPQDLRDMLEFVTEKKIRGLVQERPMSDANKAVVDLEDGKARYRYVLVNEA
ncbi:GroES-like protein [Cryphonectria parasitica EP155]|uniref:GroES-like protein n=1 Tax=Cryphonectria parasitica (strain ATCC 38755 / EP155) TaxID=660469 RepID=A0A9P4XWN6_CRYP1|nr:GroES-like protein [Cryphonectria parasitica EP155]KAF3762669.1 GroES-like protein [Cryphonectria parasitica EP155]